MAQSRQDSIKPLAFEFHDKLVAVLTDFKSCNAMLASTSSALEALKGAHQQPFQPQKPCSNCILQQGKKLMPAF
jgi:hypothetical protein